MNFINDRELARRFKNDSVPQKERFIYFFIYVVMSSIFMQLIPITFISTENNIKIDTTYIISVLVYILIVIFGTIICHKTNKAGDDREFIERMICLGFPIAIRTIIISFIIAILHLIFIIAAYFLYNSTQWSDHQETPGQSSLYDLAFMIFILMYAYWRLNSSIRIAATQP